MQRFIFRVITVARWTVSVTVSTFATLFWLVLSVAIFAAAYFIDRHLTGAAWWGVAGVTFLGWLVFVVPHAVRTLQGFLFPGVINQAHGRARIATRRDVQRAGVWQA